MCTIFYALKAISKVLFMKDVSTGKHFSLFFLKEPKKNTIGHTVVPLLLWDDQI